MSTQPIIIEIVDKIDSSIAGKIKAIGIAARQASNDITNLNAALGSVSNGTTKLSAALNNVNQSLKAPVASSNQLERSLGNLLSRAVGAELGIGRLGGAFGSLGIAVAGAGPLIVAAIAIGTIVGAVLIYDKLYAAQRKLVEGQTELGDHFGRQNDKLLQLSETYRGLVDGPLAKYQAELANLPKKSVVDDITAITAVLKDQESRFASALSFVQRYGNALLQLSGFGIPGENLIATGDFNIKGAEAFIADQKKIIAENNEQGKGFEGLKKAIADTGQELIKWHNIEQTESGVTLSITEVGRKGIQDYYKSLINELKIYNAEKKNLEVTANEESFAQEKAFAAAQLAQFRRERDALKASQSSTTAQDELALVRQQAAGASRSTVLGPSLPALPLNQSAIIDEENKFTAAINKQGEQIDTIVQKYHNHIEASTAYTEAQKAQAEVDLLLTQIQAKNIPITDALRKSITDIVTAGEDELEVGKQKVSLYKEFTQPFTTYSQAIQASSALLKENAITAADAAIANAKAARVYHDAVDPLNEYNIGLEHQTTLLQQYGQALTVATQVDQLRQTLQKQGRDLSQQQIAQLTQQLTQIEKQKEVQSELNNIYAQGVGAQQKLESSEKALDKAVADGIITWGKYKLSILEVELATNKLANDRGLGNFRTEFREVLGSLVDTSKSATQQMTTIWGTFFKSLEKGFGDSIGHALVYNDDLKKALLDTARNAVAALISSFIQLGIELTIIAALEKIFPKLAAVLDKGSTDTTKITAKNTAAAVAGIAIVTASELAAINILQTPAWDLAEAVSLASFGANAIGAEAGIAAVIAAGEAAQHLYGGGFVNGPSGVDKVPTWLTAGEFVVREGPARANRQLLESLNRGAGAVSSSPSSGGGSSRMYVSIQHDGSTGIQVQQIGENEVRVIAKQEARSAVHSYAPQVIASDLSNPNSRVSKAVAVNVVAPRKR